MGGIENKKYTRNRKKQDEQKEQTGIGGTEKNIRNTKNWWNKMIQQEFKLQH